MSVEIDTSPISHYSIEPLRQRVLSYIKSFPEGVPVNRFITHFETVENASKNTMCTYIKQFLAKRILRRVTKGIYAYNHSREESEVQDWDQDGGRFRGISQSFQSLDVVWDESNRLEQALVRLLLNHPNSHRCQEYIYNLQSNPKTTNR